MEKIEASLIGSLGLNPNTVRRGELSRLAFLLPVANAERRYSTLIQSRYMYNQMIAIMSAGATPYVKLVCWLNIQARELAQANMNIMGFGLSFSYLELGRGRLSGFKDFYG